MKVIDALDNIYFGNGNPYCLPILAQFAGDEGAEIFGIGRDIERGENRYLILNPIRDHDILQKYNIYLGNDSGECSQVAARYFKHEFFAIYKEILSNREWQNIIESGGFYNVAQIIERGFTDARKKNSNQPIQKGE